VQNAQDYYPDCPEAYLVSLARGGDTRAFEELVRRRQSSIRHLMRRCCRDTTLADDLAQQVFLKMWQNLHSLKKVAAFSGWLKRLAINVWLQHARRNDALRDAEEVSDADNTHRDSAGEAMDLDAALALLPEKERLCIVLSYQEGMSHAEITKLTEMPLGTVKAHLNRGAQKLKEVLRAYSEEAATETTQ
jgi:RNA polymerase sigma factor (sigma-70 family)